MSGKEGQGSTQKKEYHVPALEKGLAILEHLVLHGGKNLNQLCEELAISRTTVYSSLKNMESLGYVEGEGGIYRPTLKLFSLGMQVQRQSLYNEKLLPELYAIRDELEHTVHLATFEGNHSVLMYKLDGPGVVQFLSFVGETKPLHFSGVGKAILAYLPENRFQDYLAGSLDVRTERTLSTREELIQFRADTRRTGYALDDEEGEEGVFCIGVPVFAAGGGIYAGVSISMLKTSPTTQMCELYVQKMLRAGERLSRVLGYTGAYPRLDGKMV